jgi:hypothetical protein
MWKKDSSQLAPQVVSRKDGSYAKTILSNDRIIPDAHRPGDARLVAGEYRLDELLIEQETISGEIVTRILLSEDALEGAVDVIGRQILTR